MRAFSSRKIKYLMLPLIIGWALIFIIFWTPLTRAEEAKLFPFPLAETEKAISDWLQNQGFHVLRISLENNQVQFNGIKEKENWEIICQPYSPLAVLIRGRYIKNGQRDEERLKEFWAYLENYGQPSILESRNQLSGAKSIFSLLRRAVVCIQGYVGQEPVQFSGFLITPQGYIISTAHDLEKLKEVKIILANGEELKGILWRKDFHRDLSLLKVNGEFKNYIPWREGRRVLKIGEKVYLLSCGQKKGEEYILGVIEEGLRQKNHLPLWRVDMETLPGSSGSPVFDRYGNLAGIVKGRLRGTDNVGFLIPLETLFEFLKESSLK